VITDFDLQDLKKLNPAEKLFQPQERLFIPTLIRAGREEYFEGIPRRGPEIRVFCRMFRAVRAPA
jgi:hypothetical protein